MASPTPNGSFAANFGGVGGTITINTTAGDLVYLTLANEGSSGVGAAAMVLTSPNLTWIRRGGAWSNNNGSGVDCWYAISPTTLTGEVVTIANARAIDDSSCIVTCWAGATGFDTNVSIPGGVAVSSGWPTATVNSTKSDVTFIGSAGSIAFNSVQAASGWTLYETNYNGGGSKSMSAGVQYLSVSSPQTSLTFTPTGSPSTNGGIFLDAITSDTLPTPPTFPVLVGQATSDDISTLDTITLTTSAAGEVLVAVSYGPGSSSSVTSVIGASLGSFTKRGSVASSDNKAGVELWAATATGPLSSEVITAVYPGGAGESWAMRAVAFSTTSGFDSNVSLPATGSVAAAAPTSVTYSTTASAGMAVALVANGNNSGGLLPVGAAPAGWISIGAALHQRGLSTIWEGLWIRPLSAAASSASFSMQTDNTGASYAILVDALAAGSPPPAESIAGGQTLFSLSQAGTLTDTPVNESIAGAQTLGAVFQSAAIFKPGTAGTGLRQFSTFGG